MTLNTKYEITERQLLVDLYNAYYLARRHKASKSYVKEYEENLFHNLTLLRDQLWKRQYKPRPSCCFVVHKPKDREVYAATFEDRIVHHLYFNYTHDLFESTFVDDAYSCILNKGTGYGIKRLQKHIREESLNYSRECSILKLDIKGYFMHINRNKLLEICKETIQKMAPRKIHKGEPKTWEQQIDIDFVMYLTETIVLYDPTVDAVKIGNPHEWDRVPPAKLMSNSPEDCGLPIGNLTSQLFSNVYLNVFDQYMKRVIKCKHYGRYVDDAFVVSSDVEWLHSIIPKAERFLLEKLGLELHRGKIKISTAKIGVAFLGSYLKPWRIYISNSTISKIRKKMPLLKDSSPMHLRASLNSYMGFMKHTASFHVRTLLFCSMPFVFEHGHYNKDITKFILNKDEIISKDDERRP